MPFLSVASVHGRLQTISIGEQRPTNNTMQLQMALDLQYLSLQAKRIFVTRDFRGGSRDSAQPHLHGTKIRCRAIPSYRRSLENERNVDLHMIFAVSQRKFSKINHPSVEFRGSYSCSLKAFLVDMRERDRVKLKGRQSVSNREISSRKG